MGEFREAFPSFGCVVGDGPAASGGMARAVRGVAFSDGSRARSGYEFLLGWCELHPGL